MNVSPDKLHWIQQWVIKADSDLKAVEHLLTLKDDCPTEVVCFHAQQGVEKYLKALLTLLDIEFPKSHDLGELLKLLPQDKSVLLTIHEAEKLTDYAVSARYPTTPNLFLFLKQRKPVKLPNVSSRLFVHTYLGKL